jgi:hypothetical protein
MADVSHNGATIAAAAPVATPEVLRKNLGSLSTAPSAAEAITGGADYGLTQTQMNQLLKNVLEMRAAMVAMGVLS